jgi:hypothetical protein
MPKKWGGRKISGLFLPSPKCRLAVDAVSNATDVKMGNLQKDPGRRRTYPRAISRQISVCCDLSAKQWVEFGGFLPTSFG